MLSIIRNSSISRLILFFIVVGFATYLSSFWNQFVWDDDHFIHQNIFTQDLRHIKEIFTSNTTAGAGVSSNYYRPLTTLTFALDHAIWGWNPAGLHFTNTSFHIINGILLFLLLLQLRFGKVASFIVSLIFLIHPIQTEAVTYLSSRGDIFYTFFLLLSLNLFTLALYEKKIILLFRGKSLSFSRTVLLSLSILLFPLSVLSKEGALTTVPIYAGVLLIFALKKKMSLRELHKSYRSHLIIIMLLIWITLVYFGLRLTFLNFGNSLNYSGDQSLYAKDISVRMLTFLKTIIIYIRLLLVPYPLYLERSTTIVASLINPWVLGSAGIMVMTLYTGFTELKKKHTGWIFFSLILIFSNLLSVSGIIPMTGLLRENWLYMPMIGFYIILIVFLRLIACGILIRVHPKKKGSNAFWKSKHFSFILILYCSILIAMTIQQNYNWRDRIAYFTHNLRFANTARLHLNLGSAYLGKEEYDKSLIHLKKAIEIEDFYPQTHYNIANIYLKKGNLDLAEKAALKSLELDENYLYIYPVIIDIYEKKRQIHKTLPYYKRLTLIYPNDLKITILYAKALYESKQYDDADIQFKKAIKLSNNDPKLINAVAETKTNKGY